jgi:hypothetical protein
MRASLFARATAGMAAVEFSLILPIMCIMLFGMNEATLGVNIDRKLTLVSRSLADLTSRAPTMTTTEMANIFKATDAIMQPFDDIPVQMSVSSVLVTKSGTVYTGKIDWSCSKNVGTRPSGTSQADWDKANLAKRSSGEPYPVPSGFEGGSSFIVAEVLRPYTPSTGYVLTGTFNLRETTPWPVRNVSAIAAPSSCP